MIMGYNFFVGQVYHALCVHDVVNLYIILDKISKLIYNRSQKILGGDVCLKENSA